MKNIKCRIFHLKCFTGINITNESPVGRKLTIYSEKSNGEYEYILKRSTLHIKLHLILNSVHVITICWHWNCLFCFINELYESCLLKLIRIDTSSHVLEIASMLLFFCSKHGNWFLILKSFVFFKFVNIGRLIHRYRLAYFFFIQMPVEQPGENLSY